MTITIRSRADGAFVKVDGTVVGRTPLAEPVRVQPGDHKVVLVNDGQVIEKVTHVAAGSSETIDIDPDEPNERESPPAAPQPSTLAPAVASDAAVAPPAKLSRTMSALAQHPAFIPWVAAGAFAAGTLVTGILTSGARSAYLALKEQYPVNRESLEDAHGDARARTN